MDVALDESDHCDIFRSGVQIAVSSSWPSLAWSLPSTTDTADATLEIAHVDNTVSVNAGPGKAVVLVVVEVMS